MVPRNGETTASNTADVHEERRGIDTGNPHRYHTTSLTTGLLPECHATGQ
jgi:hypothetical protein